MAAGAKGATQDETTFPLPAPQTDGGKPLMQALGLRARPVLARARNVAPDDSVPIPARIAAIDRNLLRLALYELVYEDETPDPVVIDEAVEIAKKFSTPSSKVRVTTESP